MLPRQQGIAFVIFTGLFSNDLFKIKRVRACSGCSRRMPNANKPKSDSPALADGGQIFKIKNPIFNLSNTALC